MALFNPLPSGQALLLRSRYREMHLYMGWAFHKKCGSARVFEKVRNHLIKKFYIGQETGRREDPRQVAKDMKTVYTTKEARRCF